METLGWIAFYYLIVGFSISLLVLSYFLLDIKAHWKRNDFFVVIPVGIITITFGWFPVILLGLYALLCLMWLFTCKMIKKKRIRS